MNKMNAEDMLLTFQNCLAWCDEAPGRRISGAQYDPGNEFISHWVMLTEAGVGTAVIDYLAIEIDLPSQVAAQKREEFERLKAEFEEVAG